MGRFRLGEPHGAGATQRCSRPGWGYQDGILAASHAVGSGPCRRPLQLARAVDVSDGIGLGFCQRSRQAALARHLEKQLKPAAVRAGIGKIGWHTFRHTYSTMLRSLGVVVKVQQELLRHADIQTTMNIYTQAVSDAKREANSKVVRMVLPAFEQAKGPLSAAPRLMGANGS